MGARLYHSMYVLEPEWLPMLTDSPESSVLVSRLHPRLVRFAVVRTNAFPMDTSEADFLAPGMKYVVWKRDYVLVTISES